MQYFNVFQTSYYKIHSSNTFLTLYNHYVVLTVRISLNLFHHLSLSSFASSRSSRLYPVSVQSCCWLVPFGQPTPAPPYEGVLWRTSLMSSFVLCQQCPACLVRLIWMVMRWGVGSCTVAISWDVASRICLIWLVTFLCNYRQVLSVYTLSQ